MLKEDTATLNELISILKYNDKNIGFRVMYSDSKGKLYADMGMDYVGNEALRKRLDSLFNSGQLPITTVIHQNNEYVSSAELRGEIKVTEITNEKDAYYVVLNALNKRDDLVEQDYELVGTDKTKSTFAVRCNNVTSKGIEMLSVYDFVKALKLGMKVTGVELSADDSINITRSDLFVYDPDADSDDKTEYVGDEETYEDWADDLEDVDDYDEYSSETTDEEIDDLAEDYEDEDDEEPDDYDKFCEEDVDDYDSYADEETSIVDKLYEFLTEDQIKMLRKYYMWYSRRLFDNAHKDASFGLKNKKYIQYKKQQLDSLKGTNGIWKYAGFIDCGYDYDVNGRRVFREFCTLGHGLRYMHVAWNAAEADIDIAFFGDNYDGNYDNIQKALESDNSIEFGIKCIGDFFEVDSECLKQLQAAQRESLKDMCIMYDFYKNGIEKYVDDFELADRIVGAFKLNDAKAILMGTKPVLNPALSTFYAQFRQLGMIPPKSLIQEIRTTLVGWDKSKFYGGVQKLNPVFFDNIKLIYNKSYDCVFDRVGENVIRGSFAVGSYSYMGMLDWLSAYFIYLFGYRLCGSYMYDGERFTDEGGKSEKARRVFNIIEYVVSRKPFEKTFKRDMFTKEVMDYILNLARVIISWKDKYNDNGRRISESSFVDSYIVSYKGDDKYIAEKVPKDHYENSFRNQTEVLEKFKIKTGIDLEEDFHSIKDIVRDFSVTVYTPFNKNSFGGETFSTPQEFILLIEKLLNQFVVDAKSYSDFNYECACERAQQKTEEAEERTRMREKERLEQELTRQAEERKHEEERLAEEKLKEDEERKANLTDTEIVDFLKSKDLTKGNYNTFQLQVFETVKTKGVTPSYKQMYYLKQLYKAVTGEQVVVTPTSDRVQLVDREDLKKAITQLSENNWVADGLDDKTIEICKSILKYGNISQRQMQYAEKCLQYYKEHGAM